MTSRRYNTYTQLLSRDRSPLSSRFSLPSSFNQAFQPIVPHAPPSINRTHTHTHTYPLSKRTVSAPFFVFLRDIPSPPYLCHRFHLLRGLEIATLSSFYRSTRPASSKALNFVPLSNDVHRNVHRRAIHVHGRKIRMKRNTYTKLEFVSMKKFA